MTCDFTSFSIVFQLYQDEDRMIMEGCVQWNPFYGWKNSRLNRGSTEETISLLFCSRLGSHN